VLEVAAPGEHFGILKVLDRTRHGLSGSLFKLRKKARIRLPDDSIRGARRDVGVGRRNEHRLGTDGAGPGAPPPNPVRKFLRKQADVHGYQRNPFRTVIEDDRVHRERVARVRSEPNVHLPQERKWR
jgi:hypothetical protein